MRGTKRERFTTCAALGLGILLMAATGCDDKTGGSSGQLTVVPMSVEGEWAVTVTHSVTTNCGETTHDDSWTMFLVQNGNSIAMTSDAGYSANGTLNGNVLTFEYSFPDGPGTTTSSVTLEFDSLTGTSFADILSGSASYSYTDGSFNCSGTDAWAGALIPGPVGEGLSGAWNLSLTPISTTCAENPQETVTIPVTIVQVGDEVTISILGLGDFDGFMMGGGEMSLFGEYTDPQFSVSASGVLTISKDENTVSGPADYIYTDLVDPLNNCTGVVEWSMERITAIP